MKQNVIYNQPKKLNWLQYWLKYGFPCQKGKVCQNCLFHHPGYLLNYIEGVVLNFIQNYSCRFKIL